MSVNAPGEKKPHAYKISLFFKPFLGNDSHYSRHPPRKNASDSEQLARSMLGPTFPRSLPILSSSSSSGWPSSLCVRIIKPHVRIFRQIFGNLWYMSIQFWHSQQTLNMVNFFLYQSVSRFNGVLEWFVVDSSSQFAMLGEDQFLQRYRYMARSFKYYRC